MWGLRENLYFCLTDRCAIFLDLAANRYFGLSGTAELALRSIVAGDVLDKDLERSLRPLLSRGLVRESNDMVPVKPVTLDLAESNAEYEDVRASVAVQAAALVRHLAVMLEVRAFGLRAVVERRRARKARKPEAIRPTLHSVGVGEIHAAHRFVDRTFGASDRCLIRSLALIDHLAAYAVFPECVIGVRTGAFRAHCWVQHGGTVLNDTVDRIRQFTPILVL